MTTPEKTSWADVEPTPSKEDVAALTAQLGEVSIQAPGSPEAAPADTEAPDTHLVSRVVGLQEAVGEVTVESDSPLYSATAFRDFNLPDALLKGVFAMNYNKPSRIQGLAIPAILADPPKNFIGQAQSGTGKTAAFSIPMLARVDPTQKVPQAICLAPARELARQIYEVITKLAQFTDIKVLLVVPEADIPKVITQQIIIGTPGKVAGLFEKNAKAAKTLRMFVLDEADQMLDQQGLGNQSLKVHRYVPRTAQFCLFSATYSDAIAAFADKIVPSPKTKIYIPPEKLTLDKLAQFYVDCGAEDAKLKILDEIYNYLTIGQSIIFVAQYTTAVKVRDYMTAHKHAVTPLYGKMAPEDRDRAIDDFRSGKTRVLVTTNVLSRGIDVLQVSLVVNFDIPTSGVPPNTRPDPETYLHRIGRSARNGKPGLAINLVHDERSRANLTYISQHFQKKIDALPVDKLEQIGEMLDKMF